MPTILPTDENNHPIPALRLRDGGAHKITAAASSARNATAFDADTKIISLYATAGVFIRFGGSAVAATNTDHYFPAGVYYDVAIGGDEAKQYTHVAVIRADSTDGMLYVSEKI
ncbi:MAG: hypothetical protein DI586_04145 [Micavibrio aeruginosavorus]|uniref:Uncharacterized protein n=1 Tax=Micavibrio aeruginosavorus TaxID=349221 RepID=A0A2W5FR74_9BACT|nr:MAG: hypothetical protein DI586_04145 [Micavibrio aeruginosavorus]